MGRPIKKKYFGNTNTGDASTRSDDGIGGEGVSSIAVVTSGTLYSTSTTVIWTASAPQIVGGVASTGTLTVVQYGANAGKVTGFNVTKTGSGYTSAPTLTFAPASTGSAVTYSVSLTSANQNAIQFTSWVPTASNGTANTGGSAITGGDIVKQTGSKRYYVKNTQGYGVCSLTTGTVTRGTLRMTVTDWYGNTYRVARLQAWRAIVWRDTQNGSNPWVYTNGAVAGWWRLAATGTNATLTTTHVQISNG